MLSALVNVYIRFSVAPIRLFSYVALIYFVADNVPVAEPVFYVHAIKLHVFYAASYSAAG